MTTASPRIKSIQRRALTLLILGGALNYVDRATLSVANKLIQDELGIPVAKMGLLLSAFLWAYAFSQLPVGALIDRYGPRRLLGLGLFSWSVAQAAGGIVTGFAPFMAARFALGVGEAPLFPGAPALSATGSTYGPAGLRPVSVSPPPRWGTSSPFRSSLF